MSFREIIFQERESIPLFMPVFLGAGIIFGVFVPFSNWINLIVFLASVVLIAVFVWRRSRMLAISILTIGVGVYVSQTGGILETDLLVNKRFLERDVDKVKFNADIKFIDETHPTMKNMRRITFKGMEFEGDEELDFIKTAKMTCSKKMSEDLRPNDRVRVIGKLSSYKMPAIPMSFDQKQYNAIVKLDATGIVYYIKKLESQKSRYDVFSYLRRTLTQKISEVMGAPACGIASALLTGDKSSIPKDVRDKFINSGTAHILAISGLHMSVLAGILFWVFLKIFQYTSNILPRIKPRLCAALGAIPLTFLYLALSGFSPSATRAFIMTTVFLIGVMCNRVAISLRSVSAAAFLILLFDSASLFHISFQLSFCAVTALIAFYERFKVQLAQYRYEREGALWSLWCYILGSIISTTIATVATTPISVASFNRLSFTGFLGNIIAIPAISFVIMPLGLLCLLLSPLSDLFISLMESILNGLIHILEWISDLPGSNITVKSPDIWSLYAIVLGGIFICLLRTRMRFIGAIPISLGTVSWVQKSPPEFIVVPGTDVVCFIEDGKFYTTSVRKARSKIKSIQRNLGFDGELVKRQLDQLPFKIKIHDHGLFYYDSTLKSREIAVRRHPYCPAYLKNIS